jgi:hypothetical protein
MAVYRHDLLDVVYLACERKFHEKTGTVRTSDALSKFLESWSN